LQGEQQNTLIRECERACRQLGTFADVVDKGGTQLDEQVVARLRQHDRVIDAVIKATERPSGALRRSDNEILVEPQKAVRPVRVVARLLSLDASRCANEGDRKGWTDRIAAMIRLGNEVGANAESAWDSLAAMATIAAASGLVVDSPDLPTDGHRKELRRLLETSVKEVSKWAREGFGRHAKRLSDATRKGSLPGGPAAGASADRAATQVEQRRSAVLKAWGDVKAVKGALESVRIEDATVAERFPDAVHVYSAMVTTKMRAGAASEVCGRK
jgi:hypothetical protein